MKHIRISGVVYIPIAVLSLIFMATITLASSTETSVDTCSISPLSPDIPMLECDALSILNVEDSEEEITLEEILICTELTDSTEQTVTEEQVPAVAYTADDLDLLARLLTAEVGSTWIPDEVQLYVGSVVLNRIAHESFPNTLYDVIYQEGQYSPTWNGAINNTPDERTIANAKKLLEGGSILPANVVFQANFQLGSGVHCEYYDNILKTTTYFCYHSN